MNQDLEAILIAKEISPTAMRLLVFDYLSEQSSAISLTDLELGLKRADRVTIYRTIRTFEEKGLVHRIEDGSRVTKFTLCQDDCNAFHHQDLHVHFYCNNCKETFCLPKTYIPEVALPQGYKAEERELIIKGTCLKCNG